MSIQASTFEFLSELTENNNRDWFETNRKRYLAAKEDVAILVNSLIAGICEFDPGLEGVEAKHAVFRIFRDVRFSKNKSPYKTNMGAWMAPGGRKSPYAGYYVHLQPGDNSFVAGGSYHPPSGVLASIREAIDYEPETLREILADKEFKRHFKELEGSKLKTAPKGYPKDHPAIDLLRHKDLVVSCRFTDAEVLSGDFPKMAIEAYQALQPLNAFLNRAIAETQENPVL